MAGRSTYTEAEKAKVFVTLRANNFNVKRTARETGTPENTVRRWRDEWKKNGPPPEDSPEVQEAIGDFVATAKKVRQFALETLVAKIPDAKPGELITIVGVLDDKITRASGEATSRQEHVFALPSPDELRAALGPAIQDAILMAENRQDEIIDAELIALPQRAS